LLRIWDDNEIELVYLSIGKDSKLPSTGIVPQRSLSETSLQNWGSKLADKLITEVNKRTRIENKMKRKLTGF